MRQLHPEPGEVSLPEAYACPGGTLLRANMVTSLDGAAAIGGRVGALTGRCDQELLHTLRGLADVVLVGAGTLRAEGYAPLTLPSELQPLRTDRGLPAEVPLAILSNSGNLDPDASVFTDSARPPVLLTTAAARLHPLLAERAEVVVCGDDCVDLRRAVAELRDRAYRHVLSEGGPTVLARLVEAGLLDELCLATSPALVGGDGPRILTGPGLAPRQWALERLLLADDGYLFARYRRHPA